MSDIYDLTDEWDNGATVFTAIKMDVTDTASAAASLLFDLQIGSVSLFKVDKQGSMTANTATITTLAAPSSGELTIATGAITKTGSYHTVDTESDAASDDLDTINGGANGEILILAAADSARTVVVKDGTGNINCAGDFDLDNVEDRIVLQFQTSAWYELSRSNNGA